ncbi:MAG: hypothetical protein QOD94_2966 [Alphaproteobacteria bacterium]|jgi:predicted MFS family arabinose efflux permease|nr:hypothetical protein [Alphaproteobacteria bacterium]
MSGLWIEGLNTDASPRFAADDFRIVERAVVGEEWSRAAAGHAASIGISGALSFACADLIASSYGWQSAFGGAAASAVLAWLIVLVAVPGAERQKNSEAAHALFDFRPVFRNRSAMAYAIAYCLHTLEMSALRGWGVAFLGFVAVSTGTKDNVLSPAATLTALGLIGTLASVVGNEGSIYFGRRALISVAMLGSAILAGLIGLVGTQSSTVAVALMLLYGLVIWLESSSLTAGTAGSAEPSRRGATLAVHSTLGYLGGFVGPLAVGWVLDHGGGNTVEAWRNAFLMIAALMLAALVAFALMRPRDLAGDRTAS